MRKRFVLPLALLASVAFGLIGIAISPLSIPPAQAQQVPSAPPSVNAAVAPAAPVANANPRPRGARPSPKHKIFAAERFRAKAAIPASFGVVPSQLSYWLNNQVGDCVTAEEAGSKAAWSLYPGVGTAELFVPDSVVQAWARAGGYLNGADLTSVMESMAQSGFTVNGVNYTDGPYKSVDYTNFATTSAAIVEGPVKIGVAANQLENVVGTANGWYGTGFGQDGNEDHCISLWGYGTVQQCYAMLSVTPPANANLAAQAYLCFTWDTIGVLEHTSMTAITGEAWVRLPTTPQQPLGPTPPPTPTTAVVIPSGTYTTTGFTLTPATGAAVVVPAGTYATTGFTLTPVVAPPPPTPVVIVVPPSSYATTGFTLTSSTGTVYTVPASTYSTTGFSVTPAPATIGMPKAPSKTLPAAMPSKKAA